MKTALIITCVALLIGFYGCEKSPGYISLVTDIINEPVKDTLAADSLQYHPIRYNALNGSILPWFSSNPGQSYDTCLRLVWDFWRNMEQESNGLKYYMNHQVWRPESDHRGIGGDQLAMALSSFAEFYPYLGDPHIVDEMRYMADEYLARSLSDSSAVWPLIPFPYNTVLLSGSYDGDMILGKGFTQPDKAGSFGAELIRLYKITEDRRYLESARNIAITLSRNVRAGDGDRSPWPFKVNAMTGETGYLLSWDSNDKVMLSDYTSNYSGTLELLRQISKIDTLNSGLYLKAYNICLQWMVDYPLKTNKWGPFFEDIRGWSDTQINAVTFARYILNNRDEFPDWEKDVKGIIIWVHDRLGNSEQIKFGVLVTNEQTAYEVPGNSHSSRQAALELQYCLLTGDTAYLRNAIRMLNWATYMVNDKGWNRYIRDDIWLTDGYGDYIRHYLRAMATFPELAPDNRNLCLSSSSQVQHIEYSSSGIQYTVFDESSSELFRLLQKPSLVQVGGMKLKEMNENDPGGWRWNTLGKGGVLTISHGPGEVEIIF